MSFGISTWSIHRSLESGHDVLLDVPARVRDHGMTDLQICHFHFKSVELTYLADLRRRMETADVTLDALLIDFGDLSHADRSTHEVRQIEDWLEIGKELGARYARVSAGSQQPTEETLARSASHLLHLADVGERLGVKVVTENWHAMLPGPREVDRLMTLTDDRVPLCLDFGNWTGPDKYEALEAIMPRTVTVHAKCSFDADTGPDAVDFRRCMSLLQKANYAGTVALIYDGPSADEWHGIDTELSLAQEALAGT